MFPLEQTNVPSDLSDNKCEQWGPQGWGQDILWTVERIILLGWKLVQTGLRQRLACVVKAC